MSAMEMLKLFDFVEILYVYSKSPTLLQHIDK